MTSRVTAWWNTMNGRLAAPLWHLALVLPLLILPWHIWTLIGRFPDLHAFAKTHEQVARWIVTAFEQWTMVGIIWLGLRLRGTRLRDVIGGRWSTWNDFLRDLGVGTAFMFVSAGLWGALVLLLKPTMTEAHTAQFAAPQGVVGWVAGPLFALSVGICEEIHYRGYLQRQLGAITGSAIVAVLVQGVIFGYVHGYQGPKFQVLNGVAGILFGLLAHWRRSLRPGIISHFLNGVFSVVGLMLMGRRAG